MFWGCFVSFQALNRPRIPGRAEETRPPLCLKRWGQRTVTQGKHTDTWHKNGRGDSVWGEVLCPLQSSTAEYSGYVH